MNAGEPEGAGRQPEGSVGEREIVVTRTMDVARRFVFEGWTEERHIARWLGPDHFTITTRRFDFRVGGVWEFTMHGPDGTDYPNRVEWRVIEPPFRIGWVHGEREDDPQAFQSEVTLVEEDGRTHATLRSIFPTREMRDEKVERFGAIEGGRQTLEHLHAYAAQLAGTAATDAQGGHDA